MSLGTNAVIGAAGIASVAGGALFGLRWLVRHGQFSFHNSRLTTIGNPLLSKEEVQPLIDAPTTDSLSKIVQGDLSVQPTSRTIAELDRDLLGSFHASIEKLWSVSPKAARPVMDAFIKRYEAEEMKRLVRRLGSTTEPLSPIGRLTEEFERHLMASKDVGTFLEVLEVHPSYPYLSAELRAGSLDLPSVDLSLDRFALDAFNDVKGLSFGGKRGIREFHGVLCDRYNLNVVLRSLSTGLARERTLERLVEGPGLLGRPLLEAMAESGTRKEAMSALAGSYMEPFFKEMAGERMGPDVEIALDRMLLVVSSALSQKYWSTVGPTIRFLIGREMELRNLRTLFISKISTWGEERTRSMLILEDRT